MQQHLHPLRGQLPRGFREPDVIADRQAEAPDVRHVEDAKLRPRLDLRLIGPEGKHLAIARHDLARGIDDGGGVEDAAILGSFEHRTGDQPDIVLARGVLKPRQAVIVERQREFRQRPKGCEFRKQHHLRPGKPRHQDVQPVKHAIGVGLKRVDVHLHAGDCERGHMRACIVPGPCCGPFPRHITARPERKPATAGQPCRRAIRPGTPAPGRARGWPSPQGPPRSR